MPAELPSTEQLTETVLAGDSYAAHCHESFSICSFLRLLRDTVKGHFQELNRPSNYEDLYYVCSQQRTVMDQLSHRAGYLCVLDQLSVDAYVKEINLRVSLAEVFSNFIDAATSVRHVSQ